MQGLCKNESQMDPRTNPVRTKPKDPNHDDVFYLFLQKTKNIQAVTARWLGLSAREGDA